MGIRLSLTAPTGWLKAPWSGYANRENWITRPKRLQAAGEDGAGPGSRRAIARLEKAKIAAKRVRLEAPLRESIPIVHRKAGRDIADDGGSNPCRTHRLHAAAGVGAATGRLSDHANPDVLSGSKPGGRDVFDYCAARETVRP